MKTEKHCSKCKSIKPTQEFSKDARKADGFCIWCKKCSSEQQRLWREENQKRLSNESRSYYEKNRYKIREKQTAYRKENVDKLKELSRVYYQKNRVSRDEKSRQFRIDNPERHKSYGSAWRSRNPHNINAKASLRRARLRAATPSWSNQEKIQDFFFEALEKRKQTGVEHDVDHIVPITPPLVQSLNFGNMAPKKTFCGPLIPVVQGLHCEANLRVITEKSNREKSNTHWPDMPNLKI